MTGVRADSSRVRIVFIGSGGFGRASLRRLLGRDDVNLVGVVTAPPRPAGRRQRPTSSVIHELANELGVDPIITPERLRLPESLATILALEPELVVLADYGQIVPEPLLALPHGALNLHPSLLPRHRGATPIPAVILAGDAETGVTLMRMDADLDSGPIVAQERVALGGGETTPGLEARLEIVAAELLDRELGAWLRGELTAHPQPEHGASLTRPLRREDGRLDPARPTVDLERQVRALQPWPGTFVETPLGRLSVRTAAVGPSPDRPPGIFSPYGLSTFDGELLLHEVQPAGGKRMPWPAFVRGHPGIVGSAAVASEW